MTQNTETMFSLFESSHCGPVSTWGIEWGSGGKFWLYRQGDWNEGKWVFFTSLEWGDGYQFRILDRLNVMLVVSFKRSMVSRLEWLLRNETKMTDWPVQYSKEGLRIFARSTEVIFIEYIDNQRRPLKCYKPSLLPRTYSDLIMWLTVRCEYDTRTRGCITRDPCTVYGEQRQHHEYGEDDDSFDVHAERLLVFRTVFLDPTWKRWQRLVKGLHRRMVLYDNCSGYRNMSSKNLFFQSWNVVRGTTFFLDSSIDICDGGSETRSDDQMYCRPFMTGWCRAWSSAQRNGSIIRKQWFGYIITSNVESSCLWYTHQEAKAHCLSGVPR